MASRTSRMIEYLQPQLGDDSVQGARQFLPQPFRPDAELRRDLVPLSSLGPLVRQQALLVGQQPAHLGQQIAPLDDLGRAWLMPGHAGEMVAGLGLEAALIAADGLLATCLVAEL